MKRQARSYWCGIASIANALECLGIRRSQREIARLCHVSPSAGCDEVEMKRALLANGVQIDEWLGDKDRLYQLKYINYSEEWLLEAINGGPVILCVDNDEHWVTVIGLCGTGSWIIFDPSRNQGVEVHTWYTLKERWRNEEGIFYGIGVSL